jgi:hypothetical protein
MFTMFQAKEATHMLWFHQSGKAGIQIDNRQVIVQKIKGETACPIGPKRLLRRFQRLWW